MAIVGRKYHMARRGAFASKMAWHLLIVLRVRRALRYIRLSEMV